MVLLVSVHQPTHDQPATVPVAAEQILSAPAVNYVAPAAAVVPYVVSPVAPPSSAPAPQPIPIAPAPQPIAPAAAAPASVVVSNEVPNPPPVAPPVAPPSGQVPPGDTTSFYPDLGFDLSSVMSSILDTEKSIEGGQYDLTLIASCAGVGCLVLVIVYYVCKARITPKYKLSYKDLEADGSNPCSPPPKQQQQIAREDRRQTVKKLPGKLPKKMPKVEPQESIDVSSVCPSVVSDEPDYTVEKRGKQKVPYKKGHVQAVREKTEQWESS